MESIHQRVNDLTALEIDKERIEQLQRKQAPKTKVQRMKGFFNILFITGVLCQFLSALLASSGVLHYVSEKLNNNGLIISLTSICILLLIEVSKRFTLESYHAQRLDDKEINRVTYGFMLLWGCLSVGSTYYGTPYAVEYFAAAPVLVNVDSINSHYDNLLKSDTIILHNELNTHTKTANDFYTSAEWKGRISSEDRVIYDKYLEAATLAKAKISEVTILSNQQKTLITKEAIKENEQIEKSHFDWCMSFGSTLAIISILLELLFFASMFWCEGYKRLEVKEAKAILYLREETENETNITPKRNEKTNNTKTPITDTETVNIPHRTVITAFGTNNTTAINRTCSNCGTDISNKRADAKFCTTKCRGLHHKAKKI